MNPKQNSQQNVIILEKTLEAKEKELLNAKSQSKIYKQQFDLFMNKANDRCSTEKYKKPNIE